MAFGKIYSYAGNPRTIAILAVAKANNVDLEVVETEPTKGVSTEYLKLNHLGKVPTFEGANGYILTEAIAIAIYITSQNEKTALLGKTKQDYASILRWMSYGNHEVLPNIGGFFRPLIGRDPYNRKVVEDHKEHALKAIHVLEEHLLVNTFLVGERVTLADLFVAGLISRGFQFLLDAKWRSENPNTTRWYETVTNQAIYKAVVDKPVMVEEALKNIPPKKEEQPKKQKEPKPQAAPKAAAKPKAKEADDEEEEEAKPEPKAKHPLEALPKPTLVLDDWKRQYSNSDTKTVALPWFWENYKPEEYSLWRIDYKYNEELTLTFMSANLITGLFTRLEGSRKYLFGVASVYGTANDSIIRGAFLVRGQEFQPAFDVAPDWESYDFVKLDPSKSEDKQFLEHEWVAEDPIELNGKTYKNADGKVFK